MATEWGVVGEIVELFPHTPNYLRVYWQPVSKNAEQVSQGQFWPAVRAVTVNAEILAMLLTHPLTQSSVRQFCGTIGKSFFGRRLDIKMGP